MFDANFIVGYILMQPGPASSSNESLGPWVSCIIIFPIISTLKKRTMQPSENEMVLNLVCNVSEWLWVAGIRILSEVNNRSSFIEDVQNIWRQSRFEEKIEFLYMFTFYNPVFFCLRVLHSMCIYFCGLNFILCFLVYCIY